MLNRRERNPVFWKAKGNIPLWVIASKIAVSESTLHRWLRFEVEEEKMNRIMQALEEVKQEL